MEFLNKIKDANNRLFPLNYKYVHCINLNTDVNKRNRYIAVDVYQTSKHYAEPLDKPISKCFNL
jgi:hypothetical protein